jgi:hypothetical protein
VIAHEHGGEIANVFCRRFLDADGAGLNVPAVCGVEDRNNGWVVELGGALLIKPNAKAAAETARMSNRMGPLCDWG